MQARREAKARSHNDAIARSHNEMTYANPHLLWSTGELKDRLSDPKLVLMDMRPPEAYATGHIPGARSFDIFGISLIDTRPEPLNAFLWIIEHLIQAKGVNNDSTVIAYDDIAGMRSARLFWFLEFFGHDDVHLLNGGFNAWQAAGLGVTHEATIPQTGNFKMKQRPDRLATADHVLPRLHNPSAVIVDTRSDDEYTGKLVRAKRGGAIPGAVHLEWTNNLNEKGYFKSADELKKMYADLGITPDKEVIPHCQGAYRSAHTYLALRLIGYPEVRNYLGSWGEWGNRDDLPIEHPADA
jgi:thiosulfate/3-mercaptopyruvate sulfurtransferase